MALSYALTTYAHLQAWLNREVDTVLAEELIDAATVAIERAVGRAFVQRTITSERHNVADERRMYLDWAPIASVTSIQDDQDTPTTVASSNYEIEWGYLEHHTVFPRPTYRWNVTYVAGDIASTAAVTNDLRTACHRMVAHLLNAPQGPILSESKADKATSYALSTGGLPADVEELVGHYRRLGV